MKDDFIIFGSPQIESAEIEEVRKTLESGWLGTGPRVAQFEESMKKYKSAQHAAAVNSCTAALHLSMIAAGIKPGDEVITTSLTFCATVNAILHAGAIPVLADVDPTTMNINPKEVERKLNPRTKAVIPVHFAGLPCAMDELIAIAHQHDIKIIEDCAHAIETEYKGKKSGTFGDFGCLSFYVTKNVVTGEGGMVLARNEKDINRIKILALHGMSQDAWSRFSDKGYKHYLVEELGFKYNMTDLQAAIGIHQLERIERNWARRQEVWQRYQEAFADLLVTCPAPVPSDMRHSFHLYTLLIDEERAGISRDAFLGEMERHNIGVGVHYLSIPEHPFYQRTFGWKPEDHPHALRIGRQTVSLPLSAKLRDEEVDRVIEAVCAILRTSCTVSQHPSRPSLVRAK